MDKLERLFLDQQIFGLCARLVGRYSFNTGKISGPQYEVSFTNQENSSNIIKSVNLFKEKKLVMKFNVSETLNFKALSFEVSDEHDFNFHYFCITFKFFFQYIKQYTNYENLIISTTRYRSYIFRKIFGFKMIGWDQHRFYLDFNTKDGLQNIWEEFYGSGLEENLYNFMLPVEAGGFVPGNIKMKKPNSVATALMDFRKTEKRYYRGEQPTAQIKVGYEQQTVTVLNMSESGLAIMLHPQNDASDFTELQLNNVYSIWINSPELNLSWVNLSVQIVWQRDNTFGCRIRENSPAWRQFIIMMNIKNYQRLTFTDSPKELPLDH